MKSKLLTLLAAAVTLGAVSSFAQGTALPVAGAWKITPAVVSDYVFRGVRLGGLSFQPNVEYTTGAVTAGIWANVPIDDKVPGQSDPEFDFYGAYTLTLNDSVSVVPGATLYTFPRADDDKGFYAVTFEPNLAVNLTVENVVITPKFYYDTVLRGATYEINGAVAIPLTFIGSELALSASVGTYKWRESIENALPEVKNRGDYWVVGGSVPFKIGNGTLTLGYSYHQGRNNYYTDGGPRVRNLAAGGEDVYTASYSISF